VWVGTVRMESQGHGNGKSLQRVISRKALQAGSSAAPCKPWVTGFFCGACIVYLFGGVALPPLGTLQTPSDGPPLRRAILWSSTPPIDPGNHVTSSCCRPNNAIQCYLVLVLLLVITEQDYAVRYVVHQVVVCRSQNAV
jgi:hypothetical protein